MLTDNLTDLRSQIITTCAKHNRPPTSLTLIAVTKTRSAERINEALIAGVTDIGENRIQEAATKFPLLTHPCRRHLVGHLQTNKVPEAVRLFDVIQSVDSVRLAEKLSAECVKQGKTLEIFLQVNLAEEETKSGFTAEEITSAAAVIKGLPNLKLTGLMVIGPHTDDQEKIRDVFTKGKTLTEELSLPHCSAGMSSDWQVAIACGATHLRIGSGIFGVRN